MKFRTYCGIVRDKKWYNHTEVHPLQGGTLAVLDGAEKTGAARLLNLIKGSVTSFFTEEGEEYVLRPHDYEDIKVADAWKIGYEQIKLKTGEAYPIIPEYFFCNICSSLKREQYTEVNESWQRLIEDGYIDEIFLENPDDSYEVELPEPIELPEGKTFRGGTFDTLIMGQITLGDMLKIHRNPEAMESEANVIRATWDFSIKGIKGLSDADFNRVMKVPGQSFTEKYIFSDANQEAIREEIDKNTIGIIAERRVIYCKNCGRQMQVDLDLTNFFSPLLPKKKNQGR